MFNGNGSSGVALVAVALAYLMVSAVQAGSNDLPDSKQNGYAVVGGCTRDWNVDYLDLAISWGPGACSTGRLHCKRDVEPRFTIHGLWPQLSQHSSPTDCCTKTFFDFGDVKPLKKELRVHWPTLLEHGEDYYFWQREWNKHGSCAVKTRGVSTVQEYFDFSLKAFKKWNIEEILRKKGIVPSGVNWYSGSEIVATVSQAIGKKVNLICAPTRKDPRIFVFTQMHICFDTKLQPTDCKNNTSRKCREKIMFLK